MTFVLPGMRLCMNHIMYFMLAKCLCFTENKLPAFYAFLRLLYISVSGISHVF